MRRPHPDIVFDWKKIGSSGTEAEDVPSLCPP
jgi:hypothetical protein